MVFKVYSRDKLANQRLSELRFETFSKQELWLKAFVLFKSLSPVCRSWLFQISHGKYQRVSCASKEQGSLRGRRVKFQFLSVSAMASQRAAEQCRGGGGTFWSTQQGNTLVFFPEQSLPTLPGCPNPYRLSHSAGPSLAVQTLTMLCSPLPGPPTPGLQVSLGHYFILALFIIRFCS